MLGNIGLTEWLVIFLVILLMFGAKRVPEIARSLGRSIREFKNGANSVVSELKDSIEEKKPKSS
ncbi:MAG: twin-arginine translocase TatA/TatE family subunit [bacterium]